MICAASLFFCSGAPLDGSAHAETASIAGTASPRTARPFTAFVAEASQSFSIPASWIWAVMRIESAGDPRAVSPKGAMGLMQIMPKTYTGLRARHHFGPDAYNPRDNILAGAAYTPSDRAAQAPYALNSRPSVRTSQVWISDGPWRARRSASDARTGRAQDMTMGGCGAASPGALSCPAPRLGPSPSLRRPTRPHDVKPVSAAPSSRAHARITDIQELCRGPARASGG
jgi:Transglycosylase SLT domain